MSTRNIPWPAGVPCWVDLATPDVATAQEFYAGLFAWGYDETEPAEGGYLLASRNGHHAAGIGPTHGGTTRAEWTMYFATDDVEETAQRVTDAGGSLIAPPFDSGGYGRLLLATDPTGLMFGAWQAKSHIGAQIVNEPGAFVWDDARSGDPERSWEFHVAVFDHRVEPMPDINPAYGLYFSADDFPLGGIGGPVDDSPAHWLVYFATDDADRAVQNAERAGGSVIDAIRDSPYGRVARLADPAGARFAVIQPNGPQPDRST